MKRSVEVMAILEAFDLTGSYRAAAALTGCDHTSDASAKPASPDSTAPRRSQPALAKARTAPIRHRLSRGGNRRLNAAIYRIAMIQLRYKPRAREIHDQARAWSHPSTGHAHPQAPPIQRDLPNDAPRRPTSRGLDMRASSAETRSSGSGWSGEPALSSNCMALREFLCGTIPCIGTPEEQMPTKRVGEPDKETWKALTSFVGALYEEMDKLAKKSPREPVSDLAMSRINRAIRDTRSLLGPHDAYVSDLAEFVAAGENAEVRDAVLVLSEIKAALERARIKFQLYR